MTSHANNIDMSAETAATARAARLNSYSDIVDGKLRRLRGRLREQWGALTDNSADRLQGRGDQLIGLLQEKYGYTRLQAVEYLEAFVDEMLARVEDAMESAESVADTVSDAVTDATANDLPVPAAAVKTHAGTLAALAAAVGGALFFWRRVRR